MLTDSEDAVMQPAEFKRPLAACDIKDGPNPRWVTEYVTDVFFNMQKQEKLRMIPPNYMSQQKDINEKMRVILIDWLVEVHEKFNLMNETLFLTVNIIDRFPTKENVVRKKLQLVGCTAMLIASKYEEIYAPEVRDFVYISDKACRKEDILDMEGVILQTLDFQITTPSSRLFAERYFHVSGCSQAVWYLCQCILELAMMDLTTLSTPPSLLAASSLYIAMRFVSGTDWTSDLVAQTGYKEEQLNWKQLYCLILDPHPKEKAIRKKYSNKKKLSVDRFLTSAKEKHEQRMKNRRQ
eukprot:TRINITY_DN701_c0_g2_i1.p1 TRINITY_DN701_c0_g2~~TRINITY_DN701_c0_g2_i1.p1  ORF type:complete len:295 (-),score=64.53 TRINITY_DN701_c0_g2_i1:151-1035(-)